MSVQVQRKDGSGDLRLARRRALLQQENRVFEVVPPSWSPARSKEASLAACEIFSESKHPYNGAFEIA